MWDKEAVGNGDLGITVLVLCGDEVIIRMAVNHQGCCF